MNRILKVTLTTLSIIFCVTALFIISTVASLRWINPSYTAFTLQSQTEVTYDLRDYWVTFEEFPDYLPWTFITAEDQLFYEHSGFDTESIREAWTERQSGERIRGASTISQQLAKNLFLWSDQSFSRKGIEAGLIILLELFLPKERILEIYLNVAEFAPGIFGIGKASEHYFELHPTELDADKSARMAAVLPNPSRMRVEPPTPFTKQRAEWVLVQMYFLAGFDHRPEPELPPVILPDGFQFDYDLSWLDEIELAESKEQGAESVD